MARTIVNLDEKVLKRAMKLSGEKRKVALVNWGLRSRAAGSASGYPSRSGVPAGENPPFAFLETTRWTFFRAASLYRFLRRKGVTVNAFDTTIAAVCLDHRLPLLTCNRRDFEPIARHAGLKLA
jgi:hypothetical protein